MIREKEVSSPSLWCKTAYGAKLPLIESAKKAGNAVPNKVRWGILSAAKIAREQVIPALKQGTLSDVVAIASRDKGRARQAAEAFDIPKAYGSYEELLADPDIDAVYNPL